MSQPFIVLENERDGRGRFAGMLVVEDHAHDLAEWSGTRLCVNLDLDSRDVTVHRTRSGDVRYVLNEPQFNALRELVAAQQADAPEGLLLFLRHHLGEAGADTLLDYFGLLGEAAG